MTSKVFAIAEEKVYMDYNQPSSSGNAGEENKGSGTPGFAGPHQGVYNENYESNELSEGVPPNVSNFERGLSIGIGALLVYSAVKNFKKTPVRAIFRTGLGVAMVLRGASGLCPVYKSLNVDGTKSSTANVRTTFIVNRPRRDVYNAWRNLSSLSKFMKHIKSVTETSTTQSHWEAKIPENNPVSISWDAEIVKDEPGELLSWRSLPGSTVDNAGKVEFRDALGHRGTEVNVTIVYRLKAGNIGTGVARLMSPLFKKIIKEDVLNFKQYFELEGSLTA